MKKNQWKRDNVQDAKDILNKGKWAAGTRTQNNIWAKKWARNAPRPKGKK